MIKPVLGAIAVVLILMTVSVGFAQQYNLTGSGARAEGFGGAFIGVADDATAVVWNPAGLSQLQRPEASVVARVVGEKWTSTDLTGNTSRYDWTANQSHFLLNFGSLAIPFKLGQTNCVIAAAYQRQIDLYDTWDDPADKYTTTGGIETVTPGVGVQITPTFSVGVASNIWFGKSEHNETYYDYDFTIYRQWNYSGSYSGLNFVIGGMLDLEGLKQAIPLKVGVCVKTPFNLKSGDSYEYIPAIPGIYDNGVYYAYVQPISTYGIQRSVQMPLMSGFGASYRIGENLTLAADYELRSVGGKQQE